MSSKKDKDKEREFVFFIGVLAGFISGLLVALFLAEESLNMKSKSAALIEQCQIDIPRSQHCEVIMKAVVVKQENNGILGK